uniref:EF-hand domain-containing protein n=1 Tax=Glossina pallidipes TaxID=7398 RepID=A0A1B0ABF9_GLOPL
MAYKGKYTDRNPKTMAAGKIFEPEGNVGDFLKMHSIEEEAQNILESKCKEKIYECKRKSCICFPPHTPEQSLKELLSPEVKKSRFVTFREKFLERMFFKKPQLATAFPVHSKPDNYTNDSAIYGKKLDRSESLYDVVLPKKTAEDVNRDFIKWHEKYIISHKHYLPSEQINRHYGDSFKKNSVFGLPQKVDESGETMRKILQPCDRLVVINGVQKKFRDRTHSNIGEIAHRTGLHPNSNVAIGKRTKPDLCNVRDLIEDIKVCNRDIKVYTAIAHINQLRRHLFRRRQFHMYDLKSLLQKYDEDETGYISFAHVLNAMRILQIRPNESKLRLAVTHYKLLIDAGTPNERVNLEKFWKMLHMQHPLPNVQSAEHIPENLHDKETVYRIMCKDREKSLDPLLVPFARKPSDEDRTRAGDLISPAISITFGLGPSDFEVPRPKEELRRIFKRLLVDNFDAIWELARAKAKGDENCNISVNNLRETLNEQATAGISQRCDPQANLFGF